MKPQYFPPFFHTCLPRTHLFVGLILDGGQQFGIAGGGDVVGGVGGRRHGEVLGHRVVVHVVVAALDFAQCVVAAAQGDDAAGADATGSGGGATATTVHHTGHRGDATASGLWRGRDGGQIRLAGLGPPHIQPGHSLWLPAVQGHGNRTISGSAAASRWRSTNIDTSSRCGCGIAAQPAGVAIVVIVVAIMARQGCHGAGYLAVGGRGRGLGATSGTG